MAKNYVVWKTFHKPEVIARGYWDQGLLEDFFKLGEYEHVYATRDVPDGEGAIFIINGRTHVLDTSLINKEISRLRWVLFIETGDEEATFPWREIKHPAMRVWIQLPRMNEHDDTSFKLPNGYRPNTHELLASIGYQEKSLDWIFIGQVNHARREQCVEALKSLDGAYTGHLTETDAFGKEVIAYPEYLGLMAKSKIALCPSGIESPDNFRLYEALESGCVPVVDAFSTKHQAPGFWRYLFGQDIPFPIVDYWDALPKLMPELLREYPTNANKCFAWWQLKKREMGRKLIEEVKELSR